jgi:LmbE family N-acetylglucosaminyl deacetylase
MQLIQRYRPAYVITHPYEGGHPDHDAVAASVHWAVESLKKVKQRAPQIVEFASYHNSANGMETGCFVGRRRRIREKILSVSETLAKQELYDCYPSQKNVLKQFPIVNEPLRSAPVYNFERPPCKGKLLYEEFGWGITGRRWRTWLRRARKAYRSS